MQSKMILLLLSLSLWLYPPVASDSSNITRVYIPEQHINTGEDSVIKELIKLNTEVMLIKQNKEIIQRQQDTIKKLTNGK